MDELLDHIQRASIDDKSSTAALLRLCLVLADRLDFTSLSEWTSRELEGYDPALEVPSYRLVQAPAYGNFLGIGGYRASHLVIPPMSLDAEHRNFAQRATLLQPVAEYEHLAQNAGSSPLEIPWPGDMVLYYESKLRDGMILLSARQRLSSAALLGFLDTVRTRILKFAIELRKASRTSGGIMSLDPVLVETAYTMTIIGNSNNVIINSGHARMSVKSTILLGDLADRLRALSVTDDELGGLKDALRQDADSGDLSAPGPSVQGWFDKVKSRLDAAGQNAAGSLAATGIWQAVIEWYPQLAAQI